MTRIKTPRDNEDPKSFSRFIATFAEGELESAASEAMQQLGKDLLDHAKAIHGDVKGSIAIAIHFTVTADGNVKITPKLTKKAPPLAGRSAHMWLTEDGNAVEDNPKQTKLALRGVDGGKNNSASMEDKEAK